MFRDVPGCSGMFRNVPACSGMFHVPGFIDGQRIGRDVAFHMRKLTIQIVNLSLLLLVMTLTECASLSPYLILELLIFS